LAWGPRHTPRIGSLMEEKSSPRKRSIRKTVLIVDDNAVIRKTIAAAFLSDGFESCVEAENGREGINVARQTKPDIIILDLSMPVMNGLQAAPELRRLLPATPIILFSLYADAVSKTLACEAGVTQILQKAAPVTTLLETAHNLVGH